MLLCQIRLLNQGVAPQTFNPAQEAEAGGSLNLKPAWST